MLKELLDRILEIATPARWEEDGRVYSSRQMTPVRTDLETAIEVQTLTGLVELARDHSDKAFIHVISETHAAMVGKDVDEWNRRQTFVNAHVPQAPGFRFGQYLEPEDFIIGLLTNFEGSSHDWGDHKKILKLVSNLASEAVNTAADDGYSQQVTTKQGVVSKGEEKINPRVTLSPFRTFRELTQPGSEFVLRLRSRVNATPLCALFEADGGAWKNEAVIAIKKYLVEQLAGMNVVA